jgi:hypothetical protein
MIGAVIFSCSFASIGELVAGVEVTSEDKWPSLMLSGQLQAATKKRRLSVELREIAGQERHALEPRKHQATGALNAGSLAHDRKRIRGSNEDAIGCASVGQTSVAHTPVFRPIGKGAPAHIVAPFGEEDGVRVEAIEIAA